MFNDGIWPANSPDLNPIEQLWPEVIKRLDGQIFTTQDSLWAAIQVAFAAIPPAVVHNLYNSMCRRMAAVLVANGGHTKY